MFVMALGEMADASGNAVGRSPMEQLVTRQATIGVAPIHGTAAGIRDDLESYSVPNGTWDVVTTIGDFLGNSTGYKVDPSTDGESNGDIGAVVAKSDGTGPDEETEPGETAPSETAPLKSEPGDAKPGDQGSGGDEAGDAEPSEEAPDDRSAPVEEDPVEEDPVEEEDEVFDDFDEDDFDDDFDDDFEEEIEEEEFTDPDNDFDITQFEK